MGRQLRPNLLGVPFHLTTRIQWGEPAFVGLEDCVVQLIHDMAEMSDVRLIAYAIMSNHFHLVVVQGARPLKDYLQPLLRNVALRVLRRLGRQGHAFERRYRSRALLDPRYFRNAIAYVHLNPVRAGICADAASYPWTSECAFRGTSTMCASKTFAINVESALRIFARSYGCRLDDCRTNHDEYLRWRLAMDAHVARQGAISDADPLDDGNDDVDVEAPVRPDCSGGDKHWLDEIAAFARAARVKGFGQPPPREDMSRIARAALAEASIPITLDRLRSGSREREVVRIRRQVIARLHLAGYKNYQIARFLRVTSATVSKVTTTLRRRPAT